MTLADCRRALTVAMVALLSAGGCASRLSHQQLLADARGGPTVQSPETASGGGGPAEAPAGADGGGETTHAVGTAGGVAARPGATGPQGAGVASASGVA